MASSGVGSRSEDGLRAQRELLLADPTLRGRAFGEALSAQVDAVLAAALGDAAADLPVAVVAFGSYGRRELCPGSDIDVALIHGLGRRKLDTVRQLAETLWYPLWDAGVVTGHGARTVKESVALADDEADALTAMLQARHIAGDETITAKLLEGVRALAVKRRDRIVGYLADASTLRRSKPGAIAEMLEPDLKDGSGGLRDTQALDWVGWTLGSPGGIDVLVDRHYLTPDDRERLGAAAEQLLEVRVVLHRLTGGRNDLLVLQEQDAVAAEMGAADADDLIRGLAESGREVAWITREAFDRLQAVSGRPTRSVAARERPVADSVVERDGKIAVTAEAPVAALTALDAAAGAAEAGLRFERHTVELLATVGKPRWDVWERAAFLRLLRAGEGAIDVFEALDHAGALVVLMPEWEGVRSRPQRNAYHRFTVDRHLLETLSMSSKLLDDGDAVVDPRAASIEATVARACRRPELLSLAALLHDIGKGKPGDHSDVGAEIAVAFARRIGLDAEGREILGWLVRDHLLMADTATRRDLTDEKVVEGFADVCAGDPERLRLLYLLTIADSIATGPAAWNSTKKALLRDLFVKAAAVIEQRGARVVATQRREELGEVIGAYEADRHLASLPDSYAMAMGAAEMAEHYEQLAVGPASTRCRVGADGRLSVTVVSTDRRGLLAAIAGALTISGLSVHEAFLFSTDDGRALDVFRADDPFGRYTHGGTDKVVESVDAALRGELDMESALRERSAAYRRKGAAGPVEISFDLTGSETATIVDIEADDDLGLLFRVADTFAVAGFDVSLAKVLTLGERVVDVFYVVDSHGAKVTDPAVLDGLEQLLVQRLAGAE